METQNITLSLPKDLVRKAKLIAVERQTSVSGLLKEFLAEAVAQEDRYTKARGRHLETLRRGADLGTHGAIRTITRKVAHPLESSRAAQILADLSVWRVHAPEVRDVLDAIEIQRRYGLSFWDTMILHSAARLGCEVVWSEDLNPDQVYEGVRVVNPFVG